MITIETRTRQKREREREKEDTEMAREMGVDEVVEMRSGASGSWDLGGRRHHGCLTPELVADASDPHVAASDFEELPV